MGSAEVLLGVGCGGSRLVHTVDTVPKYCATYLLTQHHGQVQKQWQDSDSEPVSGVTRLVQFQL
jgi:hypothetical protein